MKKTQIQKIRRSSSVLRGFEGLGSISVSEMLPAVSPMFLGFFFFFVVLSFSPKYLFKIKWHILKMSQTVPT